MMPAFESCALRGFRVMHTHGHVHAISAPRQDSLGSLMGGTCMCAPMGTPVALSRHSPLLANSVCKMALHAATVDVTVAIPAVQTLAQGCWRTSPQHSWAQTFETEVIACWKRNVRVA